MSKRFPNMVFLLLDYHISWLLYIYTYIHTYIYIYIYIYYPIYIYITLYIYIFLGYILLNYPIYIASQKTGYTFFGSINKCCGWGGETIHTLVEVPINIFHPCSIFEASFGSSVSHLQSFWRSVDLKINDVFLTRMLGFLKKSILGCRWRLTNM